MVFPEVLLKVPDWFLPNYGFLIDRKVKDYSSPLKDLFHKPPQQPPFFPCVSKCGSEGRESQTLACDFEGALLRPKSFFPFFMLVAFEGGSLIRALLLLFSSPLIYWVLDYNAGLRVMIFISFCGLRIRSVERVSSAVLPKFFLDTLNSEAYGVVASARYRAVLTSVPRVMVETFLKEYLNADDVVGTELRTLGCFFTGFLSESGLLVKHIALKDVFGEKMPDVGIGSPADHPFISLCKEGYVVNKLEDGKSSGSAMPREKYPKPLVFHDGRLAFLPNPVPTLLMFLYLPLGLTIAIFRIMVGTLLPYKLAISLSTYMGVTIRVMGMPPKTTVSTGSNRRSSKGVLYVCNHRTLLDPVFLSTALGQHLTAVTYSVSKVSELISPIKTVRLTRDRRQDGETMQRLLSEGDLVVCPEGTTCREPYLLRFSSLFAELTDEIVPVAMRAEVGMFYGTSTASGSKCLDPIFFLMNPRPEYHIHILGKLPRELTCAGGRSSFEVANLVQKQLSGALGFECTTLTRRDKYLMLAGNEGIVKNTTVKR